MKKTAIVYSPKYRYHHTTREHPESERRLDAILNGLERSNLLRKRLCRIIKPRNAIINELRLVHTKKYVRFVKQLSELGGGFLDEDTETLVSSETFKVANLAVGGALEAVERVMDGSFRNAFVLCRPPGHHALPNRGLGFCIFNNVAIATRKLITKYGLKRILILDLDSHHGNGTQKVFYQTNKVLFISLHEDPKVFPKSGFIEETGSGEGLGYNVNIPFPFGTGNPSYWKAFKTIVNPIVEEYEPQFIVVSAGFDGYYRDPIGELSLSASIYSRLFHVVVDLAHCYSQDRIIAVLEGGYHLRALNRIVPAVISKMAGVTIRTRERNPALDKNVQVKADRIVESVRKKHSNYWTL